jgi:Secretion system C-terminal sorting domain
MKTTLLYLCLIFSGIAGAQTVSIPDVNFKNFLIGAYNLSNGELIDTNGDGEIQVSEAAAIGALQITEFSTPPILNIQGIEAFTNLEVLHVQLPHVADIDVSALTNLLSLTIEDPAMVSLNINGLTNLETFNLASSAIQSLDLSQLLNLSTIQVYLGYNDTLTSLNVGDNSQLEYITVSSTGIESLDLSGCPNIESFSFNFGGSHDVFLNIKNGNAEYASPIFSTSVYFDNNEGHKCYICIDEGEEFQNVSDNVIFSTYCAFTPGGDYNTIAGTVTFDAGNNGCDTLDSAIPFAAVQINDGTLTAVSSLGSGAYNFFTQAGTFTVTPQFENDYFIGSPATVTFADNNNNSFTQNFCITANGVHNDAEVTIIPLVPARPGFDAVYKILYKNKGNQTLSGDVTFWYNDAVLDYVSVLPAETAAATGSLSWSYYNLLPFESRQILLTLNVNSPQEIPAVNIDDTLDLTATITPLTGDESPIDNTFALKQIVVGSLDPNDITCLEGATVNPDKIGDYLHYNINFENTGTYPASFVVVKDMIDQSKFDVSSLVVLNASHAVEARVTGNKAEFYFNDINLAANGGKGNVTFKIKSLETLAVNSSVMQKADIYFDYNWPIVTNEATTTYALLNAPGFTKDASVKLYPNPAKNVVTISAESAILNIQLFDVQGRLLEALDIASRANGIYFIKIATDKGMKVEKLVKE